MYSNDMYRNFVRPNSTTRVENEVLPIKNLSGDDAKRIYIEEVKEIRDPVPFVEDNDNPAPKVKHKRKKSIKGVENKDMFITVQNNDVDTLRLLLDSFPDKINILDDYGWSLLMIACQANAVDSVKELLKRGINTSIRDKAGNSARSLVIKNRNVSLADLLLSFNLDQDVEVESRVSSSKEEYYCDICNDRYMSKQKHLSSTIHNLSASKGKKLPTNYVIPESNRGYQLMLKVGWDKESGLGPSGSGKRYPIKTVQKKDRKGLGHDKKKTEKTEDQSIKLINKKSLAREYYKSRRLEIDFRREFY